MADVAGYDDLMTAPGSAPPQAAQGKPISASITKDVAPAYSDLLSTPAPTPLPKPGETPEPVEGWSKAFKGLASRWTKGTGAITKSVAGWKLATSDHDFSTAQKEVETQDMIRATTDTDEYEKTHAFWHVAGMPVSVGDISGGWLAENLPSLGLAGVAGATGAGVAAIAGAPLAIGGLAGASLVFGTMMAGQTVYDQMQRGVSKDTARMSGLASGLVGTALGFLGAGATGEAASGAAGAILNSPTAKEAMLHTAGELAKSMGVQVGAATLNSLTDSVINYVATRADKVEKPFTIQEAQDGMLRAAVQATGVAAPLTGITGLAGLAKSKLLSNEAAANALQAHLNEAAQDFVRQQQEEQNRFLQEREDQRAQEAQQREQARTEINETLSQQVQNAKLKVADAEHRLAASISAVNEAKAIPETTATYRTEYTPPAGAEPNFHGSSSKVVIDEGYYDDAKNLYGPGFYTTDAMTVAQGYTKKGRGKEPSIYHVKWKHEREPKFVDLDQPPTPEVKKVLEGLAAHSNVLPENFDQPLKEFYSELKENMEIEGYTSQDAWEEEMMIADALSQAGFDGFTHIGGGKFKMKGQVVNHEPHKVRIYFKPYEDVDISEIQPRQVEETADNSAERNAAISEKAKVVNETHRELMGAKTELDQADMLYDAQQRLAAQAREAEEAQAVIARAQDHAAFNADEAERQALVSEVERAVRVLPGAGKKLLEAAKKAQKEGRALTDDEHLALEREVYLNMRPQEAKERLQTMLASFMKKHMPWSRTAGYMGFTQDGKLLMAMQDTPNPEALAEHFSTSAAVEHAETLKRVYDDKFYSHMQQATGLSRSQITDLGRQASKQKLKGSFIGSDGQTHFFHLTADETMSYLLWMENEDARAALTDHVTGNAFTLKGEVLDNTQRAFEDALNTANPHYLGALQGFRNFYKEMGPLLAEAHQRITGREMGLQENYGGTIYRTGTRERRPQTIEPFAPGEEVLHGEAEVDANTPGFTRRRTDSTLAIEPRGAFKNAANRVRQQGQWEAMATPARLWNQLISSPTFRYGVETKFGKHLFESLENGYVDTVHGAPAAAGQYNGWIDKIMQASTISKLALKPLQAAKHMTTVVNFALHKYNRKFIPAAELATGMLEAHANFFPIAAEILSWEEVKNRYAHVEQIATATRQDKASPGMVRAQKASMIPFELGDKYALIVGAHAVYRYVKKVSGSETIAKREAVKAFKNVLASGSMDQLSDMSRGQILKLFGWFKQPERRLAQHVMEAQRKAANFPTTENIKNAVHARVISAASAALFVLPEVAYYTVIGDQTKADEAVFRLFQRLRLGNMFSALGDLAVSLDTALNNAIWNEKHKVWEPSNAASDAATHTLVFAKDIIKHALTNEEWSMHQILSTALEAVQGPLVGVGIGIPATPIRTARDLYPEDGK